MAKKTEKAEFTGIFTPAELLAMRNISAIEKVIITDIGYFNKNGYRFSNADMGRKLGASRRTIINSLNRLRAKNMVVDTGPDKDHRCLKLNGEVSALFDKAKGAPLDRAKKFQKPTPDEAAEYAASIDFELDGKHFVDYYEARGWMVSKNKMRDWKAAVRTWKSLKEKRQKNGSSKTQTAAKEYDESYIR